MCKMGQPHKWHVTVCNWTYANNQSFDTWQSNLGTCRDMAHNHPDVAADWNWAGNGEEDTRDCGARQQRQGSMEVWPVWARKGCPLQPLFPLCLEGLKKERSGT